MSPKRENLLVNDNRNYVELDNLIRNFSSLYSEKEKVKAIREIREKRNYIASIDAILN